MNGARSVIIDRSISRSDTFGWRPGRGTRVYYLPCPKYRLGYNGFRLEFDCRTASIIWVRLSCISMTRAAAPSTPHPHVATTVHTRPRCASVSLSVVSQPARLVRGTAQHWGARAARCNSENGPTARRFVKTQADAAACTVAPVCKTMSTNDTTTQEPSAPSDTIYVVPVGGSSNTYHARANCCALKNDATGTIREKEFQNRPLRSSPCSFCIGEADSWSDRDA